MSYTAEKMDTDLAAGGWQVNCPDEDPIADLDEAMAHIIAWALSQIRAGRELVALDPAELATMRARGFANLSYIGPTEGIAP